MNILPISQYSDLEIMLLFKENAVRHISCQTGPIISSIYLSDNEVHFMGSQIISVKNYAALEKRINEVQSR